MGRAGDDHAVADLDASDVGADLLATPKPQWLGTQARREWLVLSAPPHTTV